MFLIPFVLLECVPLTWFCQYDLYIKYVQTHHQSFCHNFSTHLLVECSFSEEGLWGKCSLLSCAFRAHHLWPSYWKGLKSFFECLVEVLRVLYHWMLMWFSFFHVTRSFYLAAQRNIYFWNPVPLLHVYPFRVSVSDSWCTLSSGSFKSFISRKGF